MGKVGMKINVLFLVVLILGACSSSECKRQKNPNFFAEKTQNLPEFKKEKASKTGLGKGSTKWIFVYKPDGSKQCGMGAAVSPEAMSKELRDEGIKIKSMTKKSDGLMRIQVCGSDTGMINVFEIQESNLKSAEAIGFSALK